MKTQASNKLSKTAWPFKVSKSCEQLFMRRMILSLISCLARKRLQLQGESFKHIAFIPIIFISRQSNLHHTKRKPLTIRPTYILEHGCVVDQEAKDRASIKTSNIQLAYAYIRQPQDCEPTLISTWLESFTCTGLAGSLITTKKGPTAQQLDAVVTFISRQGLAHSTLQCDGEPALVKLVDEIGKQTGMPTRQSPASSHQLAAWQSRLFTKFRALLFDSSHTIQASTLQCKDRKQLRSVHASTCSVVA